MKKVDRMLNSPEKMNVVKLCIIHDGNLLTINADGKLDGLLICRLWKPSTGSTNFRSDCERSLAKFFLYKAFRMTFLVQIRSNSWPLL